MNDIEPLKKLKLCDKVSYEGNVKNKHFSAKNLFKKFEHLNDGVDVQVVNGQVQSVVAKDSKKRLPKSFEA